MEGATYEDVSSAFCVDIPKPIAVIPKLEPCEKPANNKLLNNNSAHTASQNTTTPNSVAAVKQEKISPPKCSASLSIFATHHQQVPTGTQTKVLTLSNLKNMVDLTAAAQPTNSSQTASQNIASSTPTITYVRHAGHNNMMVPLVTSTLTTSAPLSIASAKLQQLARARSLSAASSASSEGGSNSSLNQTNQQPLTFKVSKTSPGSAACTFTAATPKSLHALTPPSPIVASSSSSLAATATVTSTSNSSISSQQPIRNPPPIKTVSNGSAMYSVLYTGIGNKITIKRKTDGDEETNNKVNIFIYFY